MGTSTAATLVLVGGAVLTMGRIQPMQLNGDLQGIRKRTAETVLSNSTIGRGNQSGSAGLQDGGCQVLLSRATVPRSQSFSCHVQQAANAFQK
jgi:hypothetical protein